MRIDGERIKRTRLIQTEKYVVAVDVELVVPADDPGEPCYEAETVTFLREVKERAERGELKWFKKAWQSLRGRPCRLRTARFKRSAAMFGIAENARLENVIWGRWSAVVLWLLFAVPCEVCASSAYSQWHNNLKQIWFAAINYEKDLGYYPRDIRDKDDKADPQLARQHS
jgi:hypothetical protein